MKQQKDRIRSLNKASLGNLSIEELESRLQMEELDIRGEMWTGCGCVSQCAYYYDIPDDDSCITYVPPCAGHVIW